MKRLLLALIASASTAAAAAPKPPAEGERIAIVGNGLAERMLYFGHLETELHLRYPGHGLVVRNMARPGNTAGFRPHSARKSQWAFPGAEKFHPRTRQHLGEGFFPTPDEWLERVKPDTVLAFFGYNESFDGGRGVANFRAELDAFVKHTKAQKYNGAAAPRLVMVSPIAFEDLSADRDLPDGQMENENLALYTGAMKAVCAAHGTDFIDLFHPTRKMYGEAGGADFTINGFAPTDAGYRELAKVIGDGLYGVAPRASEADPEQLREAVLEKDWFWFNDYQVLNGVHVYGRRYNPFGPANYPDELKKTREMTLLREARVHQVARGEAVREKVDDSGTHALPPVETNFNREVAFLDGEEAIGKMTVAEGYKVELFASEEEFPDLASPVQMSFDNRGRLWVAVIPSYPHYRPGDERPDDKLLVLEDTDGDGKADRQTVFADGLHLPIGFEIAPEGVYVSQEPNLCLLVDDDGDGRADRTEILLHGFDSHDTHHAISAYCADPSGAFYLCEGRFLHSQVETPYGPRRCNDGGIWRFDPAKFRLERYSQTDYSNPWGISFDHWEQCYVSDASGGANWMGLPLSAKMPYGVEIPKTAQFAPKRARPTSGAEFVSSRHFPDEVQGHFMICNSIGFLGTSFHDVWEDGSGVSGKHVGDLLSSTDPNFRPVDIEFAPDGSLYLVDWHNPLIGHMQHNARDPKRDSEHGRVYRITYPSRPLVEPAKVAGAGIPELLENLKLPEYRTRYRTRRELRGRPAAEVLPAVKRWAASLDEADPGYEHHLCEALWATWAQNDVDAELLEKCLAAGAHQARAAAVHVLRYARRDVPGAQGLLMKAAGDEHGRVRMEAFVTASWMDNGDGARIALEALKRPLDKWMAKVFGGIMEHTLKDDVEALRSTGVLDLADNPGARDFLSGRLKIDLAEGGAGGRVGPTRELSDAEMKVYRLGAEVYARDAHCATCHQADGKGVPNIYPPLVESDWIDDDERLIKIALKGLWGPIEVNGQKFDPSKGVPPMMGFAGMCTDEEIAAVLSYVRTSFGNRGAFITAAQVAAVRKETEGRANFYMVDELLKEHPLK